MKITLNIDDTRDQRVIDSFVAIYDYTNNKNQSETPLAFTKRMIRDAVKDHIIETRKGLQRLDADLIGQEEALDNAVEIDFSGAIT